MGARETAHDIADQAAVWAIRIDAGSIDPDTDAALRHWLGDDPRRRGALLRAEATLSYVDRGRALADVIEKPQPGPFWMRRKLMFAGAALAAGLAAVMVLRPSADHYSTEIGQMLQVPLADGSTIDLNTQSAIEVSMHSNRREITLVRGEAWFRVAHDATRPFIVSAGQIRVRAVGTAFAVRRQDRGADVLVTEGIVQAWSGDHDEQRVQIGAGSKAYVDEDDATGTMLTSADIERALAWREGRIVLEGETLAEAVAEFNRYNNQKLVIADSSLAEEKLVGQFRATEPMTFADAIATTLGATIAQQGDTIRLSPVRRH